MKPRTQEEIKLIRKSGQITAAALQAVLKAAQPGSNLVELDKLAEETIAKLGGQSSFKTVPGYKWTTCLNLNEEVVHGIPRDIDLKDGSVDLGAIYQGWHTDASWTIVVGKSADKSKKAFLSAGEEAMWKGIKQAVLGKRVGDISQAIQETIEGKGYQVIRSLIGHGVGRELHEAPDIPGYGQKGTGLALSSGMSLAIEAIYTQGSQEVVLSQDQWTLASADGSLGAVFEMTVIVGDRKAEVVTSWDYGLFSEAGSAKIPRLD